MLLKPALTEQRVTRFKLAPLQWRHIRSYPTYAFLCGPRPTTRWGVSPPTGWLDRRRHGDCRWHKSPPNDARRASVHPAACWCARAATASSTQASASEQWKMSCRRLPLTSCETRCLVGTDLVARPWGRPDRAATRQVRAPYFSNAAPVVENIKQESYLSSIAAGWTMRTCLLPAAAADK